MAMRSSFLAPRDGDSSSAASPPMSHEMMDLLVVLLALILSALILAAILLVLRARRRAARKRSLSAAVQSSGRPSFAEKRLSSSSTSSLSHHRRRTVAPEFDHICREKQDLVERSDSLPCSPLPEIRVTLPDEVDAATGQKLTGRVVVVHLNDHGLGGLEGGDEALPAYHQIAGTPLEDVDLEMVGGLIEKARNARRR